MGPARPRCPRFVEADVPVSSDPQELQSDAAEIGDSSFEACGLHIRVARATIGCVNMISVNAERLGEHAADRVPKGRESFGSSRAYSSRSTRAQPTHEPTYINTVDLIVQPKYGGQQSFGRAIRSLRPCRPRRVERTMQNKPRLQVHCAA